MIVVIGATGSIGRELIRLFASAKTAARALVRDPTKVADSPIPTVQGDLDDPASLDRAFEGADHLFLLSPASEQQVRLQHNAIEAAKRAQFQHVVRLSAMGARADSPIRITRMHAESDQELLHAGLGWTILKPHYFSQNLLHQADTVRRDGLLYGSSGKGRIPFVDVRDIATVAFVSLTQPGYMGRKLSLTGGEAYSHAEAAEMLSSAIGKPVRYVDLSPEEHYKRLCAAGVPAWYAGDLVALHQLYRSGNAAGLRATIQEVTRGRARSLADFVRDYAADFSG